MTVTASSPIRNFPSAGWPEATGFPQAIWQGGDGVTGDVSGGLMRVELVFNAPTTPLTGIFYSINQFNLEDNGGATRTYRLSALGLLGGFDDSLEPEWRRAITVTAPVAIVGTATAEADNIRTPQFLGRQRRGATSAGILLEADNVNTIVVKFTAVGYLWTPGALNAIGGLKLPPEGLWR